MEKKTSMSFQNLKHLIQIKPFVLLDSHFEWFEDRCDHFVLRQ